MMVGLEASNRTRHIKWTFGTCSSAVDSYNGNRIYIERCCQLQGIHTLSCLSKYPEGWNTEYIQLQGHQLCDDFVGFKALRQINLEGT